MHIIIDDSLGTFAKWLNRSGWHLAEVGIY